MIEHIFSVEVLGTGPEFDAAHATLDTMPFLPLFGAYYLVAGETARAALLAHNGTGDVAVTATQAHPSEAFEVAAPASVIAAFIAHAGRDIDLQFRWDEEAHLWCLSSEQDGNYHESDDKEAAHETEAALLALSYLLIDQQLSADQEVD